MKLSLFELVDELNDDLQMAWELISRDDRVRLDYLFSYTDGTLAEAEYFVDNAYKILEEEKALWRVYFE